MARGDKRSPDELDQEWSELIEEHRLAMPGTQVLFAFLLVLPFQQRFEELSENQVYVYFSALLCAALGIILGMVLAALLIARVDFLIFAFPTTQVIVFVIAAVVVGLVAAIFPARRAAKLDPLRAIAYE